MLPCPETYVISGVMTTVSLCSDGTYFYWLWYLGSASDKTLKGQNIFLDTFRVDVRVQYLKWLIFCFLTSERLHEGFICRKKVDNFESKFVFQMCGGKNVKK